MHGFVLPPDSDHAIAVAVPVAGGGNVKTTTSLLEDQTLRDELVRRESLAEGPQGGLQDLAGPLVD